MAVSRNVTVIPAIKRVGNNKTSESKPKIRVAAYCRVSTDSEEQASSYEIQIEHYTNYIKKNKEWELAGIFADDGITGTNTKSLLFGDVLADWRKKGLNALLLP